MATTLFDQALEHYRRGRYLEARQLLDQALRTRPADPQLWNLAAASAQALGQFDDAERCLRRALAVAPDYAEGHFNLGVFLQTRNRLPEAVLAYREALRHSPRHVPALNNLGHALLNLDRVEEALHSCQAALAVDPAYAMAHQNLGRAQAHLGRFDEARRSLKAAIAAAPEHERPRYYRTLAFTTGFAGDDSSLPEMEALAQNLAALPAEEQMMLHFALGKAYGDIGQREKSFAHLLAGNREKRRRTRYDEAAALDQLERLSKVFTPALMDARKGAGQRTEVPLFIVGMPRSGSTLVEQILASHPQVYGAGECEEFKRLADALRLPDGRPALPDGIAQLPDADLQGLGQAYLGRLQARAPRAARISDKTLSNFLYAGLIHLALPQAKFVHILRDPVDTCLSCFSHLFEGNLSFAYDLAELGRYWRGYERLMGHWRSVLPPGVMLELRYEDLVDDLPGQAHRLLEHCGLEWDEACLSFHQTARAVRTASLSQVREPIHRRSVQKWRAYGDLLQPLLDALQNSPEASRLPSG